LAKYKYR